MILCNWTVQSEGSDKARPTLGHICFTSKLSSSGDPREISVCDLCCRPKGGAANHDQAVQPLQRDLHAYYRQPSAVWGCFRRRKIHDDCCQVCQLFSQCLAASLFTNAYQTVSSLMHMFRAYCCQQASCC